MVTTSEPTPIRELMPDKFLPALMSMTAARDGKAAQRATLSDMITAERTTSKHWWAVEKLLEQEGLSDAYQARMDYLSERLRKSE